MSTAKENDRIIFIINKEKKDKLKKILIDENINMTQFLTDFIDKKLQENKKY
jgi:hypothetical protein